MSKIAIALSGGVDSSLAALLLRDAGNDVIAVTLKVQNDADGQAVCAGDKAIEKAEKTAKFLGIEHHICNVCDDFSALILQYAWEEYSHARTPSPCVRCNEKIKFGKLFEFARSLGCDYFATGHYARIVDFNGVKRIARGLDPQKDQSYFLSGLQNDVVSRVLFPLGELEKTRVRELASQYQLPTAAAKDSQNVCITRPGETFAETLRAHFDEKPIRGNFVMNGKILRPHQGIHQYTVGQRHGLGDLVPQKVSFVKSVGLKDVEITTSPEELETVRCSANQAIWHISDVPQRCKVQIRYRSPAVYASILTKNDRVFIQFDTPVRAVTPGQIAAFYVDDVVIGRAILEG